MEIEFVVNGEPVPKARPRLGKLGNVYTPTRTKAYERQVAYAFMAEKNRKGISWDTTTSCPMTISVVVNFHNGKMKSFHVPRDKITRPDVDNLLKSVMDGLNGVAYMDDCCIYSATIAKQDVPGESSVVVKLKRDIFHAN
jgi:Holliday junction resolvase RusA-like endonuclease